MGQGAIAPYAWGHLEQLPHGAVRAAREIRQVFGPRVRADALARALGEMLTSDVAVVVRKITPATLDRVRHGVELITEDGAGRLVVEPEPALLTAVLARLLGRTVPVPDPQARLEAALAGALSAICIEAARRSGIALTLSPRSETATPLSGLRIETTVLLDGKPYTAAITLFSEIRPTSGERSLERALLSDLPVTLHLVAAVSEGARADVDSLRPGDVWLPGSGWLTGDRTVPRTEVPSVAVPGRAALASPTRDRGVETGRSDDGRIVVRPSIVALAAADSRYVAGGERHEAMSDTNETSQTSETLVAIALDAPVVVRVEVASVTLTAREWAKLRPGDVIETGVRLAEPVVLRVAGREVAHGELVSVDGELGVRIREIVDPGRSP